MIRNLVLNISTAVISSKIITAVLIFSITSYNIIASLQQFYRCHSVNSNETDYDVFVYLIVYSAVPIQIVRQMNWDCTVAKQHVNIFV